MSRAKCFAVCVSLLAAASTANAQITSREPKIPISGSKIESFVPPGYKIEERIDRDFEGDGRTDAALLIVPQCNDFDHPLEEANCKSEGRNLVIVLRTSPGAYKLSVSKNVVSGVGSHGDTFGGMTARGRALRFEGGSSSCAGQTGGTHIYTYRYQSGDWFLIGADDRTWKLSMECGGTAIASRLCPKLKLRAGEECIQLDRSIHYNASAQELTWTIRDATDGERTVVVRERLPRAPLRRLVDEPFEF